jgi:hypothetical protein
MEHAKKVGLLALAAAALMAFAGPASANELTAPKGSRMQVGDVFTATSTQVQLTGTINITCTDSVLNSKVTDEGGFLDDVEGSIYALEFTGCGSNTVAVITKGTWEIEKAADDRGTLMLTGTEITTLTHNILGTVHCIYVTNDTDIGAIFGGAPAKLVAASQPLPRVSTDFGCGSESNLDGTYTYTSPNPMYFDD